MTTHTLGGVAYPTGASSATGSSMTSGTQLGTYAPPKSTNIVLFSGKVEIAQVANGFVMNVGTKEGYAYDTYIASTIQEVNERLIAIMAATKMEQI
jgi:hypothetical protein